MLKNGAYEELFEYISNLEVIDTHEHLPVREEDREPVPDILSEYLCAYLGDDLKSAGLKDSEFQKIAEYMGDYSKQIPLKDKWNILRPYLERVENTSYYRQLCITTEKLYGLEFISHDSSVEHLMLLNDKFMLSLKKGSYQRVLEEKCHIKIGILDSYDLNCDRRYFRPAHRLDKFIAPMYEADIQKIEKETGVQINCFDDWLEACTKSMEQAIECGAAAFKMGLAYVRNLRFERTTRNEAEAEFNQIFRNIHTASQENPGFLTGKKFQDYMMHYVLRYVNKRSFVYQIHTGLLAGKANNLTNSDPQQLINLFLEYPNVKFDLFHMGYPYQSQVAAIAKMLPNVYVDLCWAHVISQYSSVQALLELLDTVPVSKINGFGGDSLFLDAVCGHLWMARENISLALSVKVDEGRYDIEQAKSFGRKILYDNPMELFRLYD